MHTLHKKPLRFAFVLLSLVIALPVWPATVRRLELTEVRDRAITVIAGQVVGATQRIGEGGKMVWTDYEVAVTERFKGDQARDIEILSFAGGTVGGLSAGITDVPTLQVGKHYVFFVQEGELRPMPTVGWDQGLYQIETVDVGGARKQIIVSIDGEPLQISDDGKLMRGPLVIVEDGRVRDVASQRVAESDNRVADPVWTGANGSTITQVAPEKVALPPARVFATYDDLKLFVQGGMDAVRERANNR